MKNIAFLSLLATVLSGCVTFHPTVPEDYTGPTASFRDSVQRIDSGKANIFYLSQIDGNRIEDTLVKSSKASNGHGDFLTVIPQNNKVSAQEHVFTIVGRTHYAMPIRAFSGTVYEVKGDISFSPLPNEEYVIYGKLSEENSIVWIEQSSTGDVVEKVEVKGSAELGLFEK